ncbi:MAG: hypothetical protein J7K66_02340 [Anaerolineaceae bacterium]|nr:hypothetical protein [Anaerolineaceae bacterium]
MKTLLGIAFLPLICLGVMLLTAAAAFFALWRRSQAVSQQIQKNAAVPEDSFPTNTRWERGDLKSSPQPERAEEMTKTCPACGGENAAGSSSCAYCGRAL